MSADRPLLAPDASRTPWLASLGHGFAAAMAAAFLAPNGVALVAFLGGVFGALAGARLAQGNMRTAAVALPGVGVVLTTLALGKLATGTSALVGAFGPVGALRASEWLLAGGVATGAAMAVRALSSRYRALVGLEIGAFCLIALRLLLDHRFGAIHRPFEVADPMLAAGQDPKFAFLLFGIVVAMSVALLLLREARRGRVLYHLLVLGGLASFCLASSFAGVLPYSRGGGGGASSENEGESSGGGDSSSGGGQGQRQSQGSGNRRRAVAVVLFHDDFSAPTETYYLRQGAMSRFDGPKLVDSDDGDVFTALPEGPTSVRVVPPETEARQRVETSVALVMPLDKPIALESPIQIRPEPNPDPARFVRIDRVTSVVPTEHVSAFFGYGVGEPTWDAATRALYTAPHPDARYAELARTIVAEMLRPEVREDPVAQVAAINAWLEREGVYSKHRLGETGPDPASEFLFGERIGYCVHFAHAAVHLMRALGIPSRVAVGFYVPEENRQGGSSMMVTDDLGHAWPEVYVESVGWVVADLAAERSLDPPVPPGDIELTRLLAQMARGETPTSPTPEPPDVAAAITAVVEHADEAGLAVVAALVSALVLLYLLKLGRRYAFLIAGAPRLPRAAYRSALDAFAEVGARRARGETREAFATRLAAASPSFAALTAIHVAAAFGGKADAARVAELPSLNRAARRELRRHTPRARRVLAFFDPISFLTSR